ncbi:DNA polymerase III subunit beta [Patescibacteria group bacterium]|nr:DNA polymerase III subunit beta [Patescibacteria group bacterium]
MKIICLKNHLKEVLNICEKISGKNLSLPALSNVLIEGDIRNLKFTATNLEIGVEISIPAKVEKKGKVAVPANILNNFISNLASDENIELESQNNNLLISTKNSSTLIKGQPFDDFPILPKIDGKKEFELPASDFINGLKSVWYASSFSNIKPEISSIYINSGKNNPLTFAATDSFRLAEKKFKYSCNDLNGILIPFRSTAEILRIFENKEGKIKIFFDKNQFFIIFEGIKFITRLTEGNFPDYQQIIPKKFVTDVIIDKNKFSSALKTASIFSGKLYELNIIIGRDDGVITLQTSSAETGEHTTNIQAKITGEELKMSFNYKYILDCLQHINSPEIILRFSGEGKPLLISGTNDNSFLYLAMPMSGM